MEQHLRMAGIIAQMKRVPSSSRVPPLPPFWGKKGGRMPGLHQTTKKLLSGGGELWSDNFVVPLIHTFCSFVCIERLQHLSLWGTLHHSQRNMFRSNNWSISLEVRNYTLRIFRQSVTTQSSLRGSAAKRAQVVKFTAVCDKVSYTRCITFWNSKNQK